MDEAERKRAQAIEAADGRALVVESAANVRWLLCGRGAPVDVCSTDYTVVLRGDDAFVLFMDIERSRVEAEERLEELGYELCPFPWHEGKQATVERLLAGAPRADEAVLEPLRRHLGDEERERYRAAGAATAEAMVETLTQLRPEWREHDAAAALVSACRARALVPRVVLVAGEARQPVHRHPLPTEAPLGRHALLAVTAEREGLFVSMTRLVSFGAPPTQLAQLTKACAEIDAAVLEASRPGRTLGEVFADLARAYEEHGFPDEWRRHHQGGLTGYKGREDFATPTEETRLPPTCAVAWNPSITGGAKSENTALVSAAGVEIVTPTPDLPLIVEL
ncbi:MAG TPA: M24 family metallopeptidase [Gaiellaceae bacterium]